MTSEQRIKLRSFFLRELPNFFEEKIKEITNNEELAHYIEEKKKRFKKVYNEEFIMKEGNRGFCRSISQIVALCLKVYGFNAEVRNVKFLMGNKKAQSIYYKEGLDGLVEAKKNKKDKQFYTLGVGFSNYSDDFHCVVSINDTILDMTISDMKRIKEGIIINNYWCSMEELKKRYKCILIYDILSNDVFYKGSAIMEHPNLLDIIDYVSTQISKKLNLQKKKILIEGINRNIKKMEIKS